MLSRHGDLQAKVSVLIPPGAGLRSRMSGPHPHGNLSLEQNKHGNWRQLRHGYFIEVLPTTSCHSNPDPNLSDAWLLTNDLHTFFHRLCFVPCNSYITSVTYNKKTLHYRLLKEQRSELNTCGYHRTLRICLCLSSLMNCGITVNETQIITFPFQKKPRQLLHLVCHEILK